MELAPVVAVSSIGCRSGQATGLYGVVSRGPITPVCVYGVPCSKVLPGVKLIFSADGQALAQVKTSSDGSYRIELAPGDYLVRAEHTAGFADRAPAPSRVRVTDNGMKHVDFRFDTGIR